MFIGFKTLVLLVILDMEKFDIVLVMSWLSPYYDVLDYYYKPSQ